MKKYFLLIAFLSLAACSKSDDAAPAIPGAGLPPMTSEQQARLANVSQEVTDLTGATSKYQKSNTQTGTDNKPALSQKGVKYKTAVEQSVNAGHCKVNESGAMPDGSSGEDSLPQANFKLEILDAANSICPIHSSTSLNISSSMVQGANAVSANMQFSMNSSFEAKENTAIYSDVDVFSYNQAFSAQMTMNANEAGVTMNMTGTGKGTIVSKSETTITNNISLTLNGAGNETQNAFNLQLVIEYVFNDFKAVGVVKTASVNNGTPISTFYVNGTASTQAEFTKFFSSEFTDGILQQAPLN